MAFSFQKRCRARQTKQRHGNKPVVGLNEEMSVSGDEGEGGRMETVSNQSWRCAEHVERERKRSS